MEGKRPKEKESQNKISGEPLRFMTQKHTEVWLYPDKSMTEEQLLKIIDIKYADVPKEYYTPKNGQITYEEAKRRTEALVEEYITDKRCFDVYVLYGSGAAGMRNISPLSALNCT